MSEVICPYCGATNNSDDFYCRSCFRTLPTEGEPLQTPDGGEENWLNGLRGSANDPEGSGDSAKNNTPGENERGEGEEIPDWLKRIRQRNQEENGSQEEQKTDAGLFGSSEEDIPDWLKEFQATNETPEENEPENNPENPNDWINPFEEAEPAQEETQPEDQTDWLKDLGGRETGESEAEETGGADLPDWLGTTGAESEPKNQPDSPDQGAEQPSEQEDDDDWRKIFQDQSTQAEENPTPVEEEQPAGDEEEPDWLKTFQATQEEFESQAEETSAAGEEQSPAGEEEPDWLKQFQDTQDQPDKGEVDRTPAAGEQTLPAAEDSDLDKIFPVTQDETAADTEDATSSVEEPVSPAEESDWRGSFQPLPEEPAQAEPAGENASPEEETPDWLASLSELQGQDSPAQESEPAPDDSLLPDWLQSADTVEPEGTSPDTEPDKSNIPDWLQTQPGGETTPDQPAAEEPDLDWLSSLQDLEPLETEEPGQSDENIQPAEELPDWLARLRTQKEEPAARDEPAVPPFERHTDTAGTGFEDSTPKTVKDTSIPGDQEPHTGSETGPAADTEMPQGSSEEMDLPPLNLSDMQDWFEETPADETTPKGTSADKTDSSLEPAQLPGWLQAMRPVESAMPEQTQAPADAPEAIEDSGPLAGYQGILPGNSMVTRYTRPPVYSSRLMVTDKQQSYASMLENMIRDETEAKAPVGERRIAPQTILRTLIGFGLAVILLVILFSGSHLAPLPTLYPPETAAFFNSVKTMRLSGNPAHVMVAFDYEAALSGEMNALASGVLDDLAGSAARIVTIADVPAGTVFADNLLNATAADTPNYSLDSLTVNLGYLPGGTTGLASLAANPALAAPYNLQGTGVWTQPVLSGLTRLSDFDGILLLTDNPENARAWIEQISPALGKTPLLVIASAQAAPMIQPYYQSGQVAGLLAGMQGSAAYASLSGRSSGTVNNYWDAYQTGLLLVVLIILVGGLIQGIRRFSTNPKTAIKE